nr:hypothetical protein [Tanacetum cinerariifolium]
GMQICLLDLESSASAVMEHQVMKTAKAYGKDLARNYNASHGSSIITFDYHKLHDIFIDLLNQECV